MAIYVFCDTCKTSSRINTTECSKCGRPFGYAKKYRVIVSNREKRRTEVVGNLSIAREVEAAIKADLVRDEYDIADHKTSEIITLDLFFEKQFLPWAKQMKNHGMRTITAMALS